MRPTFCAALLLASVATAAVSDSNFTESVFFNNPGGSLQITGMDWAPDGSNRLFLTEKNGRVRIIKDGALLATPFATMAPIETGSECGLVGLAFDHDFVTNGSVYFFVTVSSSEQQIIRYTASGDTGTNRTVLSAGLATTGNNHDGGGIAIGPDGKIYWSIGDNGSSRGVMNDLTLTAAKVSRLNTDGTVPADNPYAGMGNADPRIWARGLRNPFTLTFQPRTGNLWVNIVGDGYETIFVPTVGSHIGYRQFEEVNQGAGYIRPILFYSTGTGAPHAQADVATVTRAGNVATYTTQANHFLVVGTNVTVANVSTGSFNGANQIIASVPSATSFTIAQTGANESGTGGRATAIDLGNCITGGTFLESSLYPAAYRGNFFFGDYGDGSLARVQLGTNNMPSAVTRFGGINASIDMSVGPDGRLYAVQHDGDVLRYDWNTPAAAGIVVAPLVKWMSEGGQAVFMVSLATQPSGNTTVNVTRATGDGDVSVSGGTSLTFTNASWNVPQAVTLAAAQDSDRTDDTATIAVMGAGLTAETVDIKVIDDDAPTLILTPPSLNFIEGGTGMFTVALSAAPASPVTVMISRASGDMDVTITAGASLTFDGTNFATPQAVMLAAAEDADTAADNAFFSVVALGYSTRTVGVSIADNDALSPMITSTAVATAVRGGPYRYDVDASGTPAPTYSLVVSQAGMTVDMVTGVISWTPMNVGTFNVTVRATNGVAPNADQSFMISVAADMPPTATITRPTAGEVVMGPMAECYGDGVDDVRAVRAEFSIDGAMVYTDNAMGNHFHMGGAHNMWNTTTLTDGPHRVRMTVFDTGGQSAFAEVMVTVMNSTGAGGGSGGVGGGTTGAGGGTTSGVGGGTGGAGGGGAGQVSGLCGCSAGPLGPALLALAALAFRRRRQGSR